MQFKFWPWKFFQFFLLHQFLSTPKSWTASLDSWKSLELCTWTLDACEHTAARSFYGTKVSKVALWLLRWWIIWRRLGGSIWNSEFVTFQEPGNQSKKLSDRKAKKSAREFNELCAQQSYFWVEFCCHHSTGRKNVIIMKISQQRWDILLTCTWLSTEFEFLFIFNNLFS